MECELLEVLGVMKGGKGAGHSPSIQPCRQELCRQAAESPELMAPGGSAVQEGTQRGHFLENPGAKLRCERWRNQLEGG